MNLSEHFTLQELTFSATAHARGIDNTPSTQILARLTDTCRQLEVVRQQLGHPMHINSGYRSPELNRAVGGVADSAHVQGWAVDFICPEAGTPDELVREIASFTNLRFDQVIAEMGAWVHISFAPTARRQVMTATKVNGIWKYSPLEPPNLHQIANTPNPAPSRVFSSHRSNSMNGFKWTLQDFSNPAGTTVAGLKIVAIGTGTNVVTGMAHPTDTSISLDLTPDTYTVTAQAVDAMGALIGPAASLTSFVVAAPAPAATVVQIPTALSAQ